MKLFLCYVCVIHPLFFFFSFTLFFVTTSQVKEEKEKSFKEVQAFS